MATVKDIEIFAKSEVRNKVVLCQSLIEGLAYVDVGFKMSRILSQDSSLVSQGAKLLSLVLDCSVVDSSLGKYLAIQNIGILFEPELQFNLQAIIEKYSKGQTLIISAPGVVEDGVFYFENRDGGCKINLQNLTYRSV